MLNIIEKQQQENKELLNKIELLNNSSSQTLGYGIWEILGPLNSTLTRHQNTKDLPLHRRPGWSISPVKMDIF